MGCGRGRQKHQRFMGSILGITILFSSLIISCRETKKVCNELTNTGCGRDSTTAPIEKTSANIVGHLLPASATIATPPKNVIAIFSQPMSILDSSVFIIGGSCQKLPTISLVAMNSDFTVATATLSGASCGDGEDLTIALDPTLTKNAQGITELSDSVSETYTISTTKPVVLLGKATNTELNAFSSATISLTFIPFNNIGISLTNVLTAAGDGITLTSLSGTPKCLLALSGLTTSGATLTINKCTGNGSFMLHVNEGVLEDSEGNFSLISAESSVITITEHGPSLVNLIPGSSVVNPIPTVIIATFNESMTMLNPTNFILSGTCTTMPTVSAVSSNSDKTIATATLTGGTCMEQQVLTVTVDPILTTNFKGTAGTGPALSTTYTLRTTGPSASLDTPSTTLLKASTTATIALTYSASSHEDETVLTGTLTSTGGGVTVTPLSGNPACTVKVSAISKAGAILTLSACSGNGTISVHINAGTAKNTLNIPSTASPESATISIDNSPPTLLSSIPASASSFSSMPNSIVLTFSEQVNTTAANYATSSGICKSNPTISSISGSGTTTITINLNGGVCIGSQSIVLTTAMSKITDLIGNSGAGTKTLTLNHAYKKIFVTAAAYNGDLGGIRGADDKCAADSNKPDSNTYKAMVVDTSGKTRLACTSANCATGGISENVAWVLAANTDYARIDGSSPIATTTSAGIFAFPLINGFTATTKIVITGLDASWNGPTSQNCSGWTTASSGGPFSMNTAQDSSATTNLSIQATSDNCGGNHYLYCVEQ